MKIVPTIYNGENRLVLSETFVCSIIDGVKIEVPLSSDLSAIGKKVTFEVSFLEDGGKPHYEMEITRPDTVNFFCRNCAGVEWGNSAPNTVVIGHVIFKFWIGLYPYSKTAQKVTITIYEAPKF